jgi:hypothetical protein
MTKDFNASQAFQSAGKKKGYVAQRDVKLTGGEKSAQEKVKASASIGICSRYNCKNVLAMYANLIIPCFQVSR